jgi:hypothetical protein
LVSDGSGMSRSHRVARRASSDPSLASNTRMDHTHLSRRAITRHIDVTALSTRQGDGKISNEIPRS